MSIPQNEIDPVSVRIKMLKKKVTPSILKKKLKVGDAAISMALAGKRKSLLEKINRLVDSR